MKRNVYRDDLYDLYALVVDGPWACWRAAQIAVPYGSLPGKLVPALRRTTGWPTDRMAGLIRRTVGVVRND